MSYRFLFRIILLHITLHTPLQAQFGWAGQMPVNEPGEHFSSSAQISFDSSGTPWAVWHGQTVRESNTVYYSRWNGAEWERETEIIQIDSLFDSQPDIVGDFEGKPWVVWSRYQVDASVPRADIVYTSWNDTEWDSMQHITYSVRDDYIPRIATGGGELWAIWFGDTMGGPNPVCYNTYASRWNGVGWDPEMLVSHPDTSYEFGHEWLGNLAVDHEGHPHVVWNTYWDGCIFYRTFDGTNWLDPVAIVDTNDAIWGFDAYIDIDDNGHRYVVFTGPGLDVYYSTSSDGVTWSIPYQIWTEDYANSIPAIACSGPDNIWVTWYREVSFWDTHVCVSQFDGEIWSEPIEIDNDSTETDGLPNIALDSLGQPWVIWDGIWEDLSEHFSIFSNRRLSTGIWEESYLPIRRQHLPELTLSSNPFQDQLQISFVLPNFQGKDEVSLKVFSIAGQEVRNLFEGPYDARSHSVCWNGSDEV
jgi:hypothetical protein